MLTHGTCSFFVICILIVVGVAASAQDTSPTVSPQDLPNPTIARPAQTVTLEYVYEMPEQEAVNRDGIIGVLKREFQQVGANFLIPARAVIPVSSVLDRDPESNINLWSVKLRIGEVESNIPEVLPEEVQQQLRRELNLSVARLQRWSHTLFTSDSEYMALFASGEPVSLEVAEPFSHLKLFSRPDLNIALEPGDQSVRTSRIMYLVRKDENDDELTTPEWAPAPPTMAGDEAFWFGNLPLGKPFWVEVWRSPVSEQGIDPDALATMTVTLSWSSGSREVEVERIDDTWRYRAGPFYVPRYAAADTAGQDDETETAPEEVSPVPPAS